MKVFTYLHIITESNNNTEQWMLENTEKECWKHCDEKDGPCKWCGEIGMCCSQGRKKDGCDGKMGGYVWSGHDWHVCVDPRYNSGIETTK